MRWMCSVLFIHLEKHIFGTLPFGGVCGCVCVRNKRKIHFHRVVIEIWKHNCLSTSRAISSRIRWNAHRTRAHTFIFKWNEHFLSNHSATSFRTFTHDAVILIKNSFEREKCHSTRLLLIISSILRYSETGWPLSFADIVFFVVVVVWCLFSSVSFPDNC